LTTFWALAPIFAQPKSEKCFKHAEKTMETLAMQPSLQPNLQITGFGIKWGEIGRV